MSFKYTFRKKCFAGNVFETREFFPARYIFPSPKSDFSRRSSSEIRKDSIARSRQSIFDLVEGNFLNFDNPAFCTFTFAENMENPDFAFCAFRLFLRRFSRSLFGKENGLEYIGVAERQKRGALHFHFVFFNLPKNLIESERSSRFIANLWGFGFVDVRSAKKTLRGDSVRSLGAYLAKYLGKDTVQCFGKNFFLSSRGLNRPVVDYFLVAQKIESDIIESIKVNSGRGLTIINKYH